MDHSIKPPQHMRDRTHPSSSLSAHHNWLEHVVDKEPGTLAATNEGNAKTGRPKLRTMSNVRSTTTKKRGQPIGEEAVSLSLSIADRVAIPREHNDTGRQPQLRFQRVTR